MRIALFAPLAGPFATAEYLTALGSGAEERGFQALWVPEHVVLFDDYRSAYPYAADGRIPAPPESGVLEPFTSLAFLAAVTRRIRLGTGICLLPQRNPVYAAKEAANVDFLSGGRLDFGVGVGWLAEEFRVLGVPFERRGARCRSYVEVVKKLWCDATSEHKDEFYELPTCRMYPKPVQKPHPPIHFGGESEAALRRVADLGQGWYGFNRTPGEAAEGIARLTRLLEARGRRRADVQVSIAPYTKPVAPADVPRYREAGVDRLVLLALGRDRDGLLRALDGLAPFVEAAAQAA
jgi:probable F420-dependent oxidoreductase